MNYAILFHVPTFLGPSSTPGARSTDAVGRRGALRPACAATLGRQRLGGGIGDVNWG